jgi:DNA topoisomerase II
VYPKRFYAFSVYFSAMSGDIGINELPETTHGSSKRMSVERIYQKKSQLEHILLRPDTYIGSVERVTQQSWVYDAENQVMVQRDLSYVPGLYKIFDEILVNAADNKQRDPTMSCIRIDIKKEEKMIKIWNNGKGIPVVHHKVENMYVPTMIFGHLLTSSNYDDTERKVTGGRNGYGAKLCNIFSSRFVLETSSKEYGKSFKQEWKNNMGTASEPRVSSCDAEDFTCVTFYPDLAKFGMTELEQDTVDIFTRRAYDIAASARGVKVFLNGKRLPITNFKDYVGLFLKDKEDDTGNPLKVVHEQINDRWEVAVAPSSSGFQQISFVNSIATTKGGRHVDYVTDQITSKLSEMVKKKSAKSSIQVKPFQIRNHLWVFVNCLIENPTFDSQTKENMTLQSKSFGSACSLTEKYITQVSKSGVIESILSWVKFKAQEKMDKQCHKSKHTKLKGIPKLDDANDAGTKNSHLCSLILTEGDSAKSLAVAGLGVVGRDRFGVFPLRGKMLNVREASQKQIMENAEINNLIKILGLQYKQKYDTPESLKSLRYGKIMIMTDQDQDGSHIKGLLINFIHHNWPALLQQHFVDEFITPIVKVFKKDKELSFFSLPEFEEWQRNTPDWHTWRTKYYKGLGTSSSKEAKEYFSDMARHKISFQYSGPADDTYLQLAFAKNKADDRKEWLTRWMEERRQRHELNLPEEFLYNKNTSAITYSDFVNKELILFSNMDNERSIPSLVDGFKPGQRKVLFTCLKRNLVKEIKVAQLAGSVAEMSAYHHGEVSLQSTIIGLAQDFVGTNNINLLLPNGQFGTRLSGGKDAASARYIFTQLSPLTRMIFRLEDDPLLKYLRDDNQKIEPEWYIPIIPMVLVNGAEGIGTGWSTRIPNHDPYQIIENLRRMLDGVEPTLLRPCFRGFKGTIEAIDTNRYVIHGVISILDECSVEITELPIRTWTQAYKESVLEPFLTGSEKTPAVINDYKEYHTDATVRFVVKMTPEKLAEAEQQGLHKFFKLSTTITVNSMVVFDSAGCIKRYSSVMDILKEFFDLRLNWYIKRKSYMEGMLAAECLKLENQARFLLEKIEGKITIENKAKKVLIQNLIDRGYDSDPVKAWKESIDKIAAIEEALEMRQQEGDNANEEPEKADYNYILSMPLWSLTLEKKEALLAERDKKRKELAELRSKSPQQLWRDDLDRLQNEMKVLEAKLKADEEESIKKKAALLSKKNAAGKTARGVNAVAAFLKEVMPSDFGRLVEPKIDADLLKKVDADKRKKARKAGAGDEGEELMDFVMGDDMDNEVADPLPLAQRVASLSPQKVIDGDEIKQEKKVVRTNSAMINTGRGRGRGRGGASRPVENGVGKKPKVERTASTASNRGRGRGTLKRSPKRTTLSSASEGEEDDEDDDEFAAEPAPVRERIARPARERAVKAAYVFDSDESASEEEPLPKKKKNAKYDSDDSDFMVVDLEKAPKKRKMKITSDSD